MPGEGCEQVRMASLPGSAAAPSPRLHQARCRHFAASTLQISLMRATLLSFGVDLRLMGYWVEVGCTADC
jgi:hypothetical protein